MGATADGGAASRAGERLRASRRTEYSCDIERVERQNLRPLLITSFVEDWISTQSPARTRLVPYDDEVEVPHELGGRPAGTFGSFDEPGQFFDHGNRGISLHTDLLTLLNAGSLMNPAPRTRPFERPGFVKSIGYLAPNCCAPACN